MTRQPDLSDLRGNGISYRHLYLLDKPYGFSPLGVGNHFGEGYFFLWIMTRREKVIWNLSPPLSTAASEQTLQIV